jgi:very-short-patch-repair endonuclease
MKGQTNRSILKPKLQRRLRNASTDAERLLWRHLRGRQLDGCKFRRQHPFGDFILDFVCLERMIVVELDGSQHAEKVEADVLRTTFLERAEFVVLRFWNNQIFEDMDGVLEMIWRVACTRRETHPHPNPPLEGEGGTTRSI